MAIGLGMTWGDSSPVLKSMNLIRLSKKKTASAVGQTDSFQPSVSGVTGTRAITWEPYSRAASEHRLSQSAMLVTSYSAFCAAVRVLHLLGTPLSRFGSEKKS